jgi:hypothetical protein
VASASVVSRNIAAASLGVTHVCGGIKRSMASGRLSAVVLLASAVMGKSPSAHDMLLSYRYLKMLVRGDDVTYAQH